MHSPTLGNAEHGSPSTPLCQSKLLKIVATFELPKFKWINWKFLTGCDKTLVTMRAVKATLNSSFFFLVAQNVPTSQAIPSKDIHVCTALKVDHLCLSE